MSSYDKEKYERAQKKVKEIKGFYTHLTVYLLINIFLILAQMGILNGTFHFGMPAWSYFTTPFFWGIGLMFHGLYVFKDSFGFLKNWEERKIKEFMEEEEKDYQKNDKNNNWRD